MTDSFQVGCFLMVLCAVGLLIILPLAALKHQNDNFQTRIEQLESRTEYQTWWYDILVREYGKLRP